MNHSLKTLAFTAALVVAARFSTSAQEILSREDAMRLAFSAAMHEPASSAAPIRVDADLKRPVAGHDGDYGALILPETKLSASGFEAIQSDIAPVGQLWLRRLTPMVDGYGIDESRLQMVRVSHDGEEVRVPFCLMGVRKSADGRLELLVFGKGKEPIARVPLSKVERTQALPIEFVAQRESDSGTLTLRFVGRYEATLRLTELPE